MTDQERINENLQRQIDAQNARIDNVLTKVDGLIDSFQDFKEEMRQQNQMRATEIQEIRTSIGNMQNRIDEMGRHVRNMAITSMAVVGGMVVAVVGLVATVIYSILKS